MNKRLIASGFLVAGVVLFVVILSVTLPSANERSQELPDVSKIPSRLGDFPSTDPYDWLLVVENPVQGDVEYDYMPQEIVMIDVYVATHGRSHSELGYQQFMRRDGTMTSFSLEGVYRGSRPFKNTYFDEKGVMRMRLNPGFFPHFDDALHVYAFINDEGSTYSLNVFANTAWVEAFDEQFVVWTTDISSVHHIMQTDLTFVALADDMWYGYVEGDFEWLVSQNPITGRMFFGDITADDLAHAITTGLFTKTAVMIV